MTDKYLPMQITIKATKRLQMVANFFVSVRHETDPFIFIKMTHQYFFSYQIATVERKRPRIFYVYVKMVNMNCQQRICSLFM